MGRRLSGEGIAAARGGAAREDPPSLVCRTNKPVIRKAMADRLRAVPVSGCAARMAGHWLTGTRRLNEKPQPLQRMLCRLR
jgi:hypothetical protein